MEFRDQKRTRSSLADFKFHATSEIKMDHNLLRWMGVTMKRVAAWLMILSFFLLLFAAYAKEHGYINAAISLAFAVVVTIWLVVAVDFLN